MDTDLLVILGPRTSLGQAVLANGWAKTKQLLLIARTIEEQDSLSSLYPRATVALASVAQWPELKKYSSVAVCCCALGIIHPKEPEWENDIAATSRDLRIIEQVLESCDGQSVDVLFVSSVVAVTSKRSGRYYAGWKRLLEGAMAGLVGRYPNAKLSAVNPGRLTERRLVSSPQTWLQTPYDTLAGIMIRIMESKRATQRVIGIDSRLLLLARAVRLTFSALTARV